MVESIVSRWPTGDRLSREFGKLVAPRQREAANSLLKLGDDSVNAVLLWILAKAKTEGRIFSGAGNAYYYLRFSPRPIQQMLLAPNVSDARKRPLYRLLIYLEDPPPSPWEESTEGQTRWLSPERKAYVCLTMERLFSEESADSATRDDTRRDASSLIDLLRAEAIWGNRDAARYVQDSLVRRATTLLVREGYLARESLNPPSPP